MNLLMRDGQVAALLDWELSVLAPRAYDVARTELIFVMMPGVGPAALRPLLRLFGRRAARQFVEAYRARNAIDAKALDFFRALHVLRLIAVVRVPSFASPGVVRLWRVHERALVRRWVEFTGTRI